MAGSADTIRVGVLAVSAVRKALAVVEDWEDDALGAFATGRARVGLAARAIGRQWAAARLTLGGAGCTWPGLAGFKT